MPAFRPGSFCVETRRNSEERRAQRDERRHCGRADHPVEHRQHHGFSSVKRIIIERWCPRWWRQRGRCRCSIQAAGDGRDQEERDDLTHQVAQKGNAAQLRPGQIADGHAGQTVPASRLPPWCPAPPKAQQRGAYRAANQRAQNDADGNEKGFDVYCLILARYPRACRC